MSAVRDGQVSIEMNEISMEATTSTKTEEEGTIDVSRTRTEMRRWEYVLVFDDVEKECKDGEKEKRMLKKGKFELIIKALGKANIDMRLERYGDYIYCKIRLRTKTLREFADKNEIVVPLDKNVLKECAKKGLPEHKIMPFPIRHVPEITTIEPFDYMYGSYHTEKEMQKLYGDFTPLVQSQITLHILESLANSFDVTEKSSESEIVDLKDLIADPSVPLVAYVVVFSVFERTIDLNRHNALEHRYFPLHDRDESKAFESKWLSWKTMPWNIPLDGIRGYFGEKIAFYYMFLCHYTTWQFVLAFLGLVAFGFQLELWIRKGAYDPDTYFAPGFSVCVAVWSVLMIEFMKRKQAFKALHWGTTDFSKTEKPRQEFEGQMEISLLNGREELFFDPYVVLFYVTLNQTSHSNITHRYEKRRRITVSIIFVTLLVLVVISAIVGAFYVQHAAEDAGGMWKDNAALISGLVLAAQIQIFNIVCRKVAIMLNDYENHRTNTEYESALVFKIFVFQVINSYASLTYIAFFKDDNDCIGSCMQELQSSLMSIFLVGLFVSNVVETGLPWIVNKIQSCCGPSGNRKGYTMVEKAFLVLDPYDMMLGPLDDYSELLIQQGYITLFVVCFPLAPLLSLATCWIEIRSDAYKMLRVCRRPEPLGAQNVGPWESVLSAMAKLGVVTNGALICFTSRFLRIDLELELKHRLYIFMAYLVFMFFFLYILDVAIPDTPRAVDIQTKRMEFVRRKVIEHVPDRVYKNIPRRLSLRQRTSSLRSDGWDMPLIHELDESKKET